MPLAAFHSFYWTEQPPVQGPVMTAMTRYIGPPLIAILMLLSSPIWL